MCNSTRFVLVIVFMCFAVYFIFKCFPQPRVEEIYDESINFMQELKKKEKKFSLKMQNYSKQNFV